MEERKGGCKGCMWYNLKLSECDLSITPYASETEQCPCMNCLVKMICETECEDFQQYSSIIDDRNIEWYRNRRSRMVLSGVIRLSED